MEMNLVLNRVEGVYPDYQFLENATLTTGRYINFNDHKNYEKMWWFLEIK